GVTIDTGGADLKTGGAMFGMSRDKYGSAVVAGFFKALEALRPKGIKAVGYMCMVRNSIGADSYTCDEIIKARSGKRIHIYCTDAEGRITMLDPLTKMREMVLNEKNPHLFTLATLTGHAFLSKGYYASVIDNGPAHEVRFAETIQKYGDEYGQPTEISRLHPEDYAFHEAESECADLRQGNTKPSVQTIRGHQGPAAFLIRASRLDEHGTDSTLPIKFSHIDIGSAMGDYPHVTYPNPLVALLSTGYIKHEINKMKQCERDESSIIRNFDRNTASLQHTNRNRPNSQKLLARKRDSIKHHTRMLMIEHTLVESKGFDVGSSKLRGLLAAFNDD
ncbi:Putative aminopeptidase W07G4.4, partial [Toxocara canis]